MQKIFPLVMFVLGVALGFAVEVWRPDTCPPASANCSGAEELVALKTKVAALEAELKVKSAAPVATPMPTAIPAAPSAPIVEDPPAVEPESERPAPDLINMRVAAIERFVKLTPLQREQLREKFTAEGEGREAPSLDEVLGPADASVYRQQVKDAFRRAESAALDKEAYYLSRRLTLDPAQESEVRALLEQIESDMKHRPPLRSTSMRERLAAYMDSRQERADRLRQGLDRVLTADQKKQYLQLEAESPERDLPLFHGEEGE